MHGTVVGSGTHIESYCLGLKSAFTSSCLSPWACRTGTFCLSLLICTIPFTCFVLRKVICLPSSVSYPTLWYHFDLATESHHQECCSVARKGSCPVELPRFDSACLLRVISAIIKTFQVCFFWVLIISLSCMIMSSPIWPVPPPSRVWGSAFFLNSGW